MKNKEKPAFWREKTLFFKGSSRLPSRQVAAAEAKALRYVCGAAVYSPANAADATIGMKKNESMERKAFHALILSCSFRKNKWLGILFKLPPRTSVRGFRLKNSLLVDC